MPWIPPDTIRLALDQMSSALFAGKSTRRTTLSARCAGHGGTNPANGAENGFLHRRRFAPTAGAKERNKRKSGRFGGRFVCADAVRSCGGLLRYF